MFTMSKLRFLCDHLKNYYIFQATELSWSVSVETQVNEILNLESNVSEISRERLSNFIDKRKEEYFKINNVHF